MPSLSRRLLAGAVTVVLVAAGLANPSGPAGTAAADTGPAGGAVVETHRLTLLTGDEVVVAEMSDGRIAVTGSGAGDDAPTFRVRQRADEYFVVPTEAAEYVDSGQLDPDLFDVRELIELGYGQDDAALPVIIVDDTARRPSAELSALLADSRELSSLPGRSGGVLPSDLDALWDTVHRHSASRRPGELAGVRSIWLDGAVTASLDESVPQIGAPAAWDAGLDGSGVRVAVLDTGVDPEHADVAASIVAEQNFTTDASVLDRNGHGTHVTSIIAGSGAASDGLRVGVAPGAAVLVGKVLGDNGRGRESWIIAGMEWAAGQAADVVSMSLGADPSNGEDPLSLSLNSLSASTDTLFVVAAGNDGPTRETVASPATAHRALAVAAVDGDDALADFSSRGPRRGDAALKPEISAPGVAIEAARARGTYVGSPVDDSYRSASGTSMATPHVSGAAAIVTQQHPEWTAEQIKAALVASAVPVDGADVFGQGNGRVDVAAAIEQAVLPQPSTLSFRVVAAPGDSAPSEPQVLTLTNPGAAAVTVDLEIEGQIDGEPAPSGAVTVSPPAVTIPAGGAAEIDVAVAATDQVGTYSGRLVASAADGTVVARVPIGYEQRSPAHDVTFVGTDANGDPADGQSYIELLDLRTGHRLSAEFNGAPVRWRLSEGAYSVMSVILTPDGGSAQARGVAQIALPEFHVDSGVTASLDARTAVPLYPPTPDPTEPFSVTMMYARSVPRIGAMVSGFVANRYQDEFRITPSEPVTIGSFEYFTRWQLLQPSAEASLPGRPDVVLRPEQMYGAVPLDGSYLRRIVDAPSGTPEELAAATGAVALVDRSDPARSQIAADAADAGVEVLVFVNDQPGRYIRTIPSAELPILTLTSAEGAELRAALAADPALRLRLRGHANSSILYDLAFRSPGRIDSSPQENQRVRREALARASHDVKSLARQNDGADVSHVFPPYLEASFAFIRESSLPHERVDYITGGNELLWQRTWYMERPYYGSMTQASRTYSPGSRHRETWFGAPIRPGMPMTLTGNEDTGIPATRRGDVITINVPEYRDTSTDHYGFFESRWNSGQLKLFRDDELVAELSQLQAAIRTTPDEAEYRAEWTLDRTAEWAPLSAHTHTVWTFRSGHTGEEAPVPLQLLTTNLDLRLDERNEARAARRMPVGVWVGHQPSARDVPVDDVTLAVSFDDGTTWRPVRLKARAAGWQRGVISHPPLGQTNGYVSLRIEGADRDGARIEQTVLRSYRLR